MIQDRIKDIKQHIADSCLKAGRTPDSVTLIAVSKTKPMPMLQEAYDAGMREFGENKVQELTEKAEAFGPDAGICWHMIGHLQKNKVKKAVAYAGMIHSVDSLELAQEIQKAAEKLGKCQDILLEVNVADEETKFGLTPDGAVSLAEQISHFSNIRLRGLMTVAPYTLEPEENRKYFRQLRELMVDINAKNYDNERMDVLSMGMSGDYAIAVEEGATHVRVGTSIFGERNYNKE